MFDRDGKVYSGGAPDKKRDDSEILDLVRSGDRAAFEVIVLKYQDRLFNLCRYMTGNARDAEDATQDAFVKAYQKLEKYRDTGSFFGWLRRIAVNSCLDIRRKPIQEPLYRKAPDGQEFTFDPRSNTPTPEQFLQSKQTSFAVDKCLASLSPKLRTVIVLNEIEGLSYEEVSDVVGISIGTVKSRLSRARVELRARLGKWMEQK